MEIWQIILIIFLGSLVLFGILSFFIISHMLFTMHLKRPQGKWGRECSENSPAQLEMYNEGMEWAEKHIEVKKDLHIINEGLNLYAEFFDFGSKRTAIIVSGRTEGLRYGYFFAKPYEEKGYNLLFVDQRAHGESDGRFNTLGFDEHRDLLAWSKLLHDEYGTEGIVFHGICIGAANSMYALTSKDSPSYLLGLIAEGMYPNFMESFKNHMIELKKPVQPILTLVCFWMKVYTGHNMSKGPIDVIDKMDRALLMLHSKEDLYSLPSEAEKLFRKSAASPKELVWFEKGPHSHLRRVAKEKYDNSIKEFLDKL